MARDRLSQEYALKRIAAQLPLSSKILLADVEIDNSGDRLATRRQVERLVENISRCRWFLCRTFVAIISLSLFVVFILLAV